MTPNYYIIPDTKTDKERELILDRLSILGIQPRLSPLNRRY